MRGTEQELPGDIDLLEQVFERVGVGLFVLDAAGTLLLTNPAAQAMLGYSQAEMVGRRAHDLFHYLDPVGVRRSAESCRILRAASSGVRAEVDDDVFVRADGSLVPVGWDATPVLDSTGAAAGAVVVFRDVTIKAGQELATSAELALVVSERDASAAEIGRVRFLSRVIDALSATLDPVEAAQRLARLVVPRFADWCVVDLLEGEQVHRAALAHRRPELLDPVADIAEVTFGLPPVGDTSSLNLALRGGGPQVVDSFDRPEPGASQLARNQAELFDRLGAEHAIVVGMRARRTMVGALTLVRHEPYDAGDVLMADDIGRRAAVSLDNIRLYVEQRTTAEALQRTLLPDLPDVRGLDLCATYQPSRQSAEVGGDWYDAIVLSPDRTLLVLGDVAGHDLAAAVRMSAIRNLLRAATMRAEEPAMVLEDLDRAMARFVPDTTATVVVALVERLPGGAATLSWSNAGHPAPLLVGPDGSRFLEERPDPLLGIMPGVPRSTHRCPLPAGSMLVLYTDGLVERRDRSVDDGMELLRTAATGAHPDGVDICSYLVGALDDGWEDDIALIVATVPAEG